MKLIFAQGNPGKQYERTRHNVGFIILDALAAAENAEFRAESKFRADIATLQIGGEKVLLVKPLSFYNDTGLVARALVDFYKLTPAEDLLVIHDELALPFGTVRIREKGSDAGNNGIKSLNAHLGQDYARIRVGIWDEHRNRTNDVDFVLSAFSADDMQHLQKLATSIIIPRIHDFVAGTLEAHSQHAPHGTL